MFRLNIVLLILFITSFTSAQQSQFAPYSVQSYSVDYFTGDVYCLEWISGTVLKLDSQKKVATPTDLPSVPIFANKSHIGVVYDYEHRDTYLYNFETKTKTLLLDSILIDDTEAWPLVGGFSPNDLKIALGDYEYDLSKGKLYEPGSVKFRLKEVWSSDSSLIVYDDQRKIYQYFPDSKRLDTLVAFPGIYPQIDDISFSSRLKKLYYTTRESPYNVLLHEFDIVSHKDSVIYDMIKAEVKSLTKQFVSMSWSPDEKMLGFIGRYATQSDADLYVYHADSSKVFKLTNISNNAGIKDFLNWLDNKTFIYNNVTNAHQLYSYKLSSEITYVEAKKGIPGSYSLSNYPNPFNSSTIICFSVPERCNSADLSIYNSLGQKVKTFYTGAVEKGSIERVSWNGTDESGRGVSSGIYYALLNTREQGNINSQALKLILIK